MGRHSEFPKKFFFDDISSSSDKFFEKLNAFQKILFSTPNISTTKDIQKHG